MSINASAKITAPHDNAIQLGNAKLVVALAVVDLSTDPTFDLDNFLSEIEIYLG